MMQAGWVRATWRTSALDPLPVQARTTRGVDGVAWAGGPQRPAPHGAPPDDPSRAPRHPHRQHLSGATPPHDPLIAGFAPRVGPEDHAAYPPPPHALRTARMLGWCHTTVHVVTTTVLCLALAATRW